MAATRRPPPSVSSSSSSVPRASRVLDDAPLGHVSAWLERARGRFTGPEVTVAITDRDGLLGTVADSRAKRPIRDDELFLIASVSKSFTAALVMQEAAAGHLA